MGASCTPLLVTPARDTQYDHTPVFIDASKRELQAALRSVYRLETVTKFRFEDETVSIGGVGTAIAIDTHHLWSLHLVVTLSRFSIPSPFGGLEFPIAEADKIEETTSIVHDDGSRTPLQRLYVAQDLDFTLLKLLQRLHPFPYALGNTTDFRLGNVVVLLGNLRAGISVRLGHITQLAFVQYGERGEIAETKTEYFGFSVLVREGDSGSPLLLVRDGQLELGGLAQFYLQGVLGIGFGLKINAILARLVRNSHAGTSSIFSCHPGLRLRHPNSCGLGKPEYNAPSLKGVT